MRRRRHFDSDDYSRLDDEATRDEYYDAKEDEPVIRDPNFGASHHPQILEDPADSQCDLYAYALNHVHNEDRKYHLRSIPLNCTNDASLTKHIEADDIQHLDPQFFTTINPDTFSKLPGKKSITPDQMANLPAECLQSLTVKEVSEMREDVLEKVPPEKLAVVPPDVRAYKSKVVEPSPEPVKPLAVQPTTKFALPVSLGS